MAKEELILKLQMLEQQANGKREQAEELDRQLSDMANLRKCLEKLGETGKEKEILANLGRGIFLNAKSNDDKVFVNVGSRILVRKRFNEAVEIIEKQIVEIEKMRLEAIQSIEEINIHLYNLLGEAQRAED